MSDMEVDKRSGGGAGFFFPCGLNTLGRQASGGGQGDEDDSMAVSSASSDTSDPDWGVNWGGTVTSSSFRALGLRSGLPPRSGSRGEEWPSLDTLSMFENTSPSTPSRGSRAPNPFADEPGLNAAQDAAITLADTQTDWSNKTPDNSCSSWPEKGVTRCLSLASSQSRSPRSEYQDHNHAKQAPWVGLQLRVVTGPMEGKVFEARPDASGAAAPRVSIGRHQDNMMVLADDEVSSYHADVRWDASACCWSLRDRGSLNGTRLNGRSVSEANRSKGQRHFLAEGDILQLGTKSQLCVSVLGSLDLSSPMEQMHQPLGKGDESTHSLPSSPFLSSTPPPSLTQRLPMANSSGNFDVRSQSFPQQQPHGLSNLVGRCISLVSNPPSAASVCASPPRPIKTKSIKQEQHQAPVPLLSPVTAPEERCLRFPPLGISAALMSVVGRHHRLKGQPSEDKAGWEVPLVAPGLPEGRVAMFGIYDGHGGIKAAEEVHSRLPSEVATRLAVIASDAEGGGLSGIHEGAVTGSAAATISPGSERTAEALKGAYLGLDASLGCDEGCTATCVLVWRESTGYGGGLCIQAANVGDSAALFVPLPPEDLQQHQTHGTNWAASLSLPFAGGEEEGGDWVSLTTDHRLINPQEQARLEAIGVHARNGRLYGLNLGRSLGDKCLKDADLGLLATPSISPLVRVPNGTAGLVIIASDGLWDSLSQAGAADIALRAAGGDPFHGSQMKGTEEEEPVPVRVANALMQIAERHKRTDDITIIVVELDAS